MASPPNRKDDGTVYSWTQADGEIQHKNPEPPKIKDAVAKIDKNSFMSLTQMPCVRQSLMMGIGSGAAIMGLNVVARGRLRRSINIGVYSGVGITWASYEYCQYRKRQEDANMKRAVDVVKEAKMQKEAQAIETMAQTPEVASTEKKRSWYKFW